MGAGGGRSRGNGGRLARAAGGGDPAAVWTGGAGQGDAGGDRGRIGHVSRQRVYQIEERFTLISAAAAWAQSGIVPLAGAAQPGRV